MPETEFEGPPLCSAGLRPRTLETKLRELGYTVVECSGLQEVGVPAPAPAPPLHPHTRYLHRGSRGHRQYSRSWFVEHALCPDAVGLCDACGRSRLSKVARRARVTAYAPAREDPGPALEPAAARQATAACKRCACTQYGLERVYLYLGGRMMTASAAG